MSTSCHWENTTDGANTYVYPPLARAAKDNKTLQCLITVFSTRF